MRMSAFCDYRSLRDSIGGTRVCNILASRARNSVSSNFSTKSREINFSRNPVRNNSSTKSGVDFRYEDFESSSQEHSAARSGPFRGLLSAMYYGCTTL